ncbi:MAG: hypothetical protein COA93_11075 [Alphaproteobacteria bacterium]|nr:MAG: hypothetical protein COA93_11075 [Alphaproteobacteria bacterium]
MSETKGQEEPTMEEILASIRKIISEDDVEEEKPVEASEAVAEPESEPESAPESEPESKPEEEPEEVLELTEMVEEELEVEPEPEEAEPEEAEPEPEPEEPEPEEPEPKIDIDLAIDDVDPAPEDEGLMSGEESNFTMDQFGVLSDLLTTGYQGAGNTLEDLVREMLKPMLKTWLDKNLPPIVERMVAKEIARLARTKKP